MWVARTVAFAELCKLIKKIVGQDEIIRRVLGVLLYFKLTIGYSFRTVGRKVAVTIVHLNSDFIVLWHFANEILSIKRAVSSLYTRQSTTSSIVIEAREGY